MINATLIPWMIDPELPSRVRDRTHRIALHEARIATEFHRSTAQAGRSLRSLFRSAGATLEPRHDLTTCCA